MKDSPYTGGIQFQRALQISSQGKQLHSCPGGRLVIDLSWSDPGTNMGSKITIFPYATKTTHKEMQIWHIPSSSHFIL